MDNLKIEVLSDWRDIDSVKNESIEIRSLFSDLGFDLQTRGINYSGESFFYTLKNKLRGCCAVTFEKSPNKEITLQELRDMVVLKRNDVGDAKFINKVTGIKYFISSVGEIYFWGGNWEKCHPSIRIESLEPIKDEAMREYLFKYNDQYTLVELSKEDAESNPEQYIEVPPSGVNKYNYLYKNGINLAWTEKPTSHYGDLLWKREKELIIDKLVDEVKHSHYKKDVSHLNVIDPYRIADLYALHPCAEHIMKKSLCAGNRGHKDTLRDIQDIIDTAERWKQMIEEDNSEI